MAKTMTKTEIATKTLDAMKKQFIGETRDILDDAINAIEYEEFVKNNIKAMHDMQHNTDEDIYDKGFYNGIEYCLSCLEKRDAQYKSFSKKEIGA